MHLFGNAPICASTVLECSCCRIHRNVAAPKIHYTEGTLFCSVHEEGSNEKEMFIARKWQTDCQNTAIHYKMMGICRVRTKIFTISAGSFKIIDNRNNSREKKKKISLQIN